MNYRLSRVYENKIKDSKKYKKGVKEYKLIISFCKSFCKSGNFQGIYVCKNLEEK